MKLSKKLNFIILIFIYVLFIILLPLGIRYLKSFSNISDFTSFNHFYFPLLYFIGLSILFVFPIYLKVKGYKIIIVILMNISVLINFLFQTSNLKISEFFHSISFLSYIYHYSSLLVLFVTSIIMLTISIYFLINMAKRRNYLYLTFFIFLTIYSSFHFIWFASLYLTIPNILDFAIGFHAFNFLYNVIDIFKRDGMIYLSISIGFLYFNRHLFSNNKETVNKSKPYIIWFFFGFLGMERSFKRTKLYIMNFQILSSVIILTPFLFRYDYPSFNILKVNFAFYILFYLLILTKILVWIYSLFDIFKDREDIK